MMAGATFLAFPIGPILGGWLLTNYWWGWVFLINVPVIALGLAAVVALMAPVIVPDHLGLTDGDSRSIVAGRLVMPGTRAAKQRTGSLKAPNPSSTGPASHR